MAAQRLALPVLETGALTPAVLVRPLASAPWRDRIGDTPRHTPRHTAG